LLAAAVERLELQTPIFLRAAKNRAADPSEIRAFEFKREFRRSTISLVSETIDINRSFFR
jgi:hypothetical protein